MIPAGSKDKAMQAKLTRSIRARAARILFAVFFCTGAFDCSAGVKMPNGEYQIAVDDLSVKVIGGTITVSRTWQAIDQNHGTWQWLFNPAWADLKFTFDSIDGSVKSIQRAESTFSKAGSDVFVYGAANEKQTFIKKSSDGTWRWYDSFGNWATYGADGKSTAYGDRNNASIHFVRDSQGNINQITDAANHVVLTYHYTANVLTSISDYSGRSVTYHYTGALLTTVTDVVGNDWAYGYTGGLLTSQTDPEHGASGTTMTSYSGNRVVGLTDPMGFVTTYSYDYDRSKNIYTIVEKDPAPSSDAASGVRIESHYDANAKMIYRMVGTRILQQLVKDGTTVEITIDERGLQTRVTYDSQHNPVAVVYPDGSAVSTTYDGVFSNVTSRIDENGVQSKFQYDAHGNLVTKIEAFGKPEQRITTYTYDSYGQRLTQTVKGLPVPQGVTPGPNDTQYQDATTTWTYDAYGNIASSSDPLSHTTYFLLYDVMGNVLKKKDARGYVTTYTYDARGSLTTQSDALNHTVSYGFDKVGNRTTVADAQGHVTTYVYDKNNRLVSIVDPVNIDGTQNGTRSISYFNDGRLKQKCDQSNVCATYAYDSDGRLISSTDDAGNVTRIQYGDATQGLAGLEVATVYPTFTENYKYDNRGRRTQAIQLLPAADGQPEQNQITSFGYDAAGRLISVTDALGRVTLSQFDALGQPTQSTDALGGVSIYSYDSRSNVLAFKDANNHTHSFVYDLAGRKVSESKPLGETITYSYDETNNLIQRGSPKGDKRVFTFDEGGRRVREDQYPAGSSLADQSIVYTYDERNILSSYIQSGSVQSSATYSYDVKNQKTVETTTFGSGTGAFTKTIRYDYYLNGRKKHFIYPDGLAANFSYTANDLLASATALDGSTVSFSNFIWKTPTRIQMPGIVRTLSLDALQRATEIKAQAIGSGTIDAPAGKIVMDYNYSFDKIGNISKMVTADGEYDYTYDNLDRLTSATPPANLQAPSNPNGLPIEQYTYDAVHNRISSQQQPGLWKYNADNQLVMYGAGSGQLGISFDANGNAYQQKKGDPASPSSVRTFSYNAAERLIAIDDDGVTTGRYQYDPMGRRIQKNVAGTITWFQYSDEGVIAEFDASGNPTKAYGWIPGDTWGPNPIWLAVAGSNAWTVYQYQNDYLGAPQLLTNAIGTVVWKGISEAFGKVHEQIATTANSLRLPGQRIDEESGLHYNFFRDYDTATGRFIERDPTGLDGGSSEYVYVEANPLRLMDPLGLAPEGSFPGSSGQNYCAFACALGEQLRKMSDVDDKEHCARIGKHRSGVPYEALLYTDLSATGCDIPPELPPDCDQADGECHNLHVHPLKRKPLTPKEVQNYNDHNDRPISTSGAFAPRPKADPNHPSDTDRKNGACLYTNEPKSVINSKGGQVCSCP